MEIRDSNGKPLRDVTVHMTAGEVTELLVASAGLDDETTDHLMIRDPEGRSLAVYRETNESTPLERQTDWWVGVAILLVVMFVVVGVYTVARNLLGIIF
jgi:hypothetical protein